MAHCDPAQVLQKLNSKGLSYKQYLQRMREAAQETKSPLRDYAALNLQRTLRLEKVFHPPESLKPVLRSCIHRATWVVITEPWCGDSAQSLPCIAKIAGLHPGISLGILLRDENSEVMDCYLTGGKRAIPKLIAFSPEGEELFRWGPRPGQAQELFERVLRETGSKEAALRELHAWYAKDRCRSLAAELEALIRRVCRRPSPFPS